MDFDLDDYPDFFNEDLEEDVTEPVDDSIVDDWELAEFAVPSNDYIDLDPEPEEQIPLRRPQLDVALPTENVLTGNAWNSMLAQAFTVNATLTDSLPLPWETGAMKNVFANTVVPRMLPSLMDDTDLQLLSHKEPVLDIASSSATTAALGPGIYGQQTSADFISCFKMDGHFVR